MLIETEFQGPGFVAVPNHVVDLVGEVLTGDALAALVWLARRPKGFQVAVPVIRRAFGWGKDRWQRIARELRDAGALVMVPIVCNETGRLHGKGLIVRWPEPKAGKSGSRETVRAASQPKAGKPGSRAGKPGSEKPENPAPLERRNKAARGGASKALPPRAAVRRGENFEGVSPAQPPAALPHDGQRQAVAAPVDTGPASGALPERSQGAGESGAAARVSPQAASAILAEAGFTNPVLHRLCRAAAGIGG